MKERPILFSAPMVRALLNGTKTQTRRTVKVQPPAEAQDAGMFSTSGTDDGLWIWLDSKDIMDASTVGEDFRCPYGQVGDRLWVRETFAVYGDEEQHVLHYKATHQNEGSGWKPSIHMRREYSRILLEVASVRLERLWNITEADALAEGVEPNCSLRDHSKCRHDEWIRYGAGEDDFATFTARESFKSLWQFINGESSWGVNPWVWVVEFKRIQP